MRSRPRLTASLGMQRVRYEGGESCAVLDGNQTENDRHPADDEFESCVVLDGNQTELSGAIEAV